MLTYVSTIFVHNNSKPLHEQIHETLLKNNKYSWAMNEYSDNDYEGDFNISS